MQSNLQQREIILIADPRILAINIIDNQEPLIDLRDQHDIAYGPSPEIPNNTDYTYLRKSVYEKLKQAQSMLLSTMRFCLYEGYRSLQLQKSLFDERYKKIKNQYPDWTHQAVFIETIKLISPVINLDGSNNIPPHTTGGAFDVYLIDVNGNALDMGIHPKDWMSDLEGTLSATDSVHISAEAQQHRAMMSDVLTTLGFVNYPTEYWHWSYGDRYWAFHANQTHAMFDSCNPM